MRGGAVSLALAERVRRLRMLADRLPWGSMPCPRRPASNKSRGPAGACRNASSCCSVPAWFSERLLPPSNRASEAAAGSAAGPPIIVGSVHVAAASGQDREALRQPSWQAEGFGRLTCVTVSPAHSRVHRRPHRSRRRRQATQLARRAQCTRMPHEQHKAPAVACSGPAMPAGDGHDDESGVFAGGTDTATRWDPGGGDEGLARFEETTTARGAAAGPQSRVGAASGSRGTRPCRRGSGRGRPIPRTGTPDSDLSATGSTGRSRRTDARRRNRHASARPSQLERDDARGRRQGGPDPRRRAVDAASRLHGDPAMLG